MPSLTPLAEGTETLTALAELSGSDTPAQPALYPSLDTFPSVAGTYPSVGTASVPGVGLSMTSLAEGSLDLTVLQEA